MQDAPMSPVGDSLTPLPHSSPEYTSTSVHEPNNKSICLSIRLKPREGDSQSTDSSHQSSGAHEPQHDEDQSPLDITPESTTPDKGNVSVVKKKGRKPWKSISQEGDGRTSLSRSRIPRESSTPPPPTRLQRQLDGSETPLFGVTASQDERATSAFLSRNLNLPQLLGIYPENTAYHGPKGNSSDTTMQDNNNEYCESCSGPGVFICCEACPRVFHFACAEPPVDPDHIPAGEWFCNQCRAEKFPIQEPLVNTPFSQLITELEAVNPAVFFLPDEIARYFKDVSVDPETGAFVDTFWRKTPKKSIDDGDGDVSTQECHQCHRGVGTMIQCDFCHLRWHIDCLELPLVNPPSNTTKWMCPRHAEQYLPRKRQRRHSFSNLDNTDNQVLPNEKIDPGTLAVTVLERTVLNNIKEKEILRVKNEREEKARVTKDESEIWLKGLLKFQESMAASLLKEKTEAMPEEEKVNIVVKDNVKTEQEIKLIESVMKWQSNEAEAFHKTAIETIPSLLKNMEPLFVQYLAWCKLMDIAKASQESNDDAAPSGDSNRQTDSLSEDVKPDVTSAKREDNE